MRKAPLEWVRAMRAFITTAGGCSRCEQPLPALEEESNGWDEPTEDELLALQPAGLATLLQP